jgi:hypothetical protein
MCSSTHLCLGLRLTVRCRGHTGQLTRTREQTGRRSCGCGQTLYVWRARSSNKPCCPAPSLCSLILQQETIGGKLLPSCVYCTSVCVCVCVCVCVRACLFTVFNMRRACVHVQEEASPECVFRCVHSRRCQVNWVRCSKHCLLLLLVTVLEAGQMGMYFSQVYRNLFAVK